MLRKKLLKKNNPESEHFILDIDSNKLKFLDDPLAWLSKLDRAYEVFTDLVGDVPYNGEQITILESTKWNQYWAVAGNPIHWSPAGIPGELQSINQGDWSFGMLHEIGHDFDISDAWVWDGEMSANFKMAFVIDTLPDVIVTHETRYGSFKTGYPRIKEYYRRTAETSGEAQRIDVASSRELQGGHGDPITFHLLELVDLIGWQPFRLTYRTLRVMPKYKIPNDPTKRLRLFVETLNQYKDDTYILYILKEFLKKRGFPL